MAEPASKHYKKLLSDRQRDVSEEMHYEMGISSEGVQNNNYVGHVSYEPQFMEPRDIENGGEQFRHEPMGLFNLTKTPASTHGATMESRIEKPHTVTSDVYNRGEFKTNLTTISNQLGTFPQNPSPYGPIRPQTVSRRTSDAEFLPKISEMYQSPLTPQPFIPHPVKYSLAAPPYPYPEPRFRGTPPPPYPGRGFTSRPVTRLPICHVPQPEKHVSFSGVNQIVEFSNQYPANRKRKCEETMSTIAAVGLTDLNCNKPKQHKYYCEFGEPSTRTYDLVTPVSVVDPQETITLRRNRDKDEATSSNALGACGVPGGNVPEGNLPKLFVFEDLLAKRRIQAKFLHESKTDLNQTIVSSQSVAAESRDYTVNTNVGTIKRPCNNVEAVVGISGNGDGSVFSKRSTFTQTETQPPRGKLYYHKSPHRLVRRIEVHLPSNVAFHPQHKFDVVEYIAEMKLVRKYVPRDFYLFYKYVSGYQVYHHSAPMSFLTFIKAYNTNRLKTLLENYIQKLEASRSN